MEEQERIVFAPSVEGLLIRGVGSKLSPEARSELRAVGIDLDRPLLPGYPSPVWHRALEVVARHVYPGLDLDEANLLMGESTVHGLEETFIGKAMMAMARLVGPRRTLLRLPISVKTGSNFAHLTVKELAPNLFELTSAPYMSRPQFMQGAVRAALQMSGGTGVDVQVVSYDAAAERLVLRAGWTA